MTTFVISKESADKLAKSLINMKEAVVVIESKLPNCPIEKIGRNQIMVTYKGKNIFFSKKEEVVVINGRGGQAFRKRALGFSEKGIIERIESGVREIDRKVAIAEEAHERMEARREAMRQRRSG